MSEENGKPPKPSPLFAARATFFATRCTSVEASLLWLQEEFAKTNRNRVLGMCFGFVLPPFEGAPPVFYNGFKKVSDRFLFWGD